MSSKKKKRLCPFSSSKPRAKKRKKAFNSEVATELASSDKGSFYNQEEWLEEIASHEPDTSESVEISASRLTIRLEDTEIKKLWQAYTTSAVRKSVLCSLPLEVAIV